MSLHWIIAALMIFMLFFGEDLIKRPASTFLPSVHVSIGSAILMLSVFRLIWRVLYPPPALPAAMREFERMASKAAHGLFYILLVGLPLTGWLAFPRYLADKAAMTDISIFGLTPVPGAPDVGLPMKDIHETGSKFAIAMLALHVLAALKHHFFNRDDVLRRMLPF